MVKMESNDQIKKGLDEIISSVGGIIEQASFIRTVMDEAVDKKMPEMLIEGVGNKARLFLSVWERNLAVIDDIIYHSRIAKGAFRGYPERLEITREIICEQMELIESSRVALEERIAGGVK